MTGSRRYDAFTVIRAPFLPAILAAIIILAACGREPAPTPNIPVSPPTPPAAATATTTPADTPAPAAAATATAAPADMPTPPAPADTPTPPQATGAATAPTAPPTATPAPAPPESDPEAVAAIRRIVYAYWTALNRYDVDSAITMLEHGYRAQEEEAIRSDIGRMKLFGATLEVSEETPPTVNADGNYETYLTLRTPVDTRRALMVFSHIDGRWQIIFSGEQ